MRLRLYFQIYPGFSPSPSVKGYSQGPPVYAHQGSYIVQQGYPGKGAENDVWSMLQRTMLFITTYI